MSEPCVHSWNFEGECENLCGVDLLDYVALLTTERDELAARVKELELWVAHRPYCWKVLKDAHFTHCCCGLEAALAGTPKVDTP